MKKIICALLITTLFLSFFPGIKQTGSINTASISQSLFKFIDGCTEDFDLTGDSIFDAEDISFLVEIIFSGKYKSNYDINYDGYINVLDLVSQKKALAYGYTEDNIIKNGGFERYLKWWKLNGSKSNYCAVTTGGRTGDHCLKLQCLNSQWCEAVIQWVEVKQNTDYTINYYTKRVSGTGAWHIFPISQSLTQLKTKSGRTYFNQTDTENWYENYITFNSGDNTSVMIKLSPECTDNSSFLIDDITMYEGIGSATVTPLTLTSFGTSKNRLGSTTYTNTNNLIKYGNFESKTSVQWNTENFLTDEISITTDSTSNCGSHVLYYNSSGNKNYRWYYFPVTVSKNTDYTFSCFVKGAYLSENNKGTATFGVIDPNNRKFLIYENYIYKLSSAYLQIEPTAWDNNWHLRSVTFNSGDRTEVYIGIYGANSQMWLDGMELFKSSNGSTYSTGKSGNTISVSYNVTSTSCSESDNLLLDSSLSSDKAREFWQSGAGWKNGFMSFYIDSSNNTKLMYSESNDKSGIHYIKWIDVSKNTTYTFSTWINVLSTGEGYLTLLSRDKGGASNIVSFEFNKETYPYTDNYISCKFNTGNVEKIGIAIVDKGGSARLDNLRLFKTS